MSRRHAAQCLAKLTLAFEPGIRLSADAASLRMEVWLEACGDLGDALWAEATARAIRELKWMPKPAEFRELVVHHLRRRHAQQEEARRLTTHGGGWRRESTEQRLRGAVATYRKLGRREDADRFQAELDRLLAEDAR